MKPKIALLLLVTLNLVTGCKKETGGDVFAASQPPLEIKRVAEEKPSTAGETEAGKVYLKTILNGRITAKEFQTHISPLLEQKQWVFTGEEPLLYAVDGIRNTDPNPKAPISRFAIPAGNMPQIGKEMLELIRQDMMDRNTTAAADKVVTILACSNRLAYQHIDSTITSLTSATWLGFAKQALTDHPGLLKIPAIRAELARCQGKLAEFESVWDRDLETTTALCKSLPKDQQEKLLKERAEARKTALKQKQALDDWLKQTLN